MNRRRRSCRRGRSGASVYGRTADPARVPAPPARRPLLAAAAGLLLSGCVFHGPHATARVAPERHPLAGKQLSLTVAGRRPATARVVRRARLHHGAVRTHAPAGPAAPWLPAVVGLGVAAGEPALDGLAACRRGLWAEPSPPADGPVCQDAADDPARVAPDEPSAAGSRSG